MSHFYTFAFGKTERMCLKNLAGHFTTRNIFLIQHSYLATKGIIGKYLNSKYKLHRTK